MNRPHLDVLYFPRAAWTAVASIVLLIIGAVSSWSPDFSVPFEWWPVLVILLVQSVVLLWSARAPAGVLALTTLLYSTTMFLDLADISSVAIVPAMVAAYGVGVRLRGRVMITSISTTLVAVSAVNAVIASRWLSVPEAILSGTVQAVLSMGPPVALGVFVAMRRRLVRALRTETIALQQAQQARIDTALAEERAGIARELHDIAAHHLAGIALMTAAVERQVGADPSAARAGLQQIREQTRLVLGDLRDVVGLLRGDEDLAMSDRRIRSIPDLVAAAAAHGAVVRLDIVRGEGSAELASGLGPVSQIVGYRMVQEALANVALHAPGASSEVVVDDAHPDHVEISVRNGAFASERQPSTGEGFGLLGMGERAALVGGELQYGPASDGGWSVRLRLFRDDVTTLGSAA